MVLDDLLLKPTGIYGSREEIVRYLREMGTVYVEMDAETILGPGLYITRRFGSTTEAQTYVVYWPEDTTWNDNATLPNSGWYESTLESYWATKVISSMGEQSVGKSYTLSHLLDTSFAGSAMRTAKGIWISVAPPEGPLMVALDLEGIHSLERSTQEDTLLVNTAISNLVCRLLHSRHFPLYHTLIIASIP